MDWGILHLSGTPAPLPPEAWADVGVNRILTVAMLAVSMLVLKDYLRLLPLLGGCLVRSRGNLEIEHSVSQARNRNRCALAGLGILCLLCDRCGLYPAGFIAGLAPEWKVAAIFGIFEAYILLHRMASALLRKPRLDAEGRTAAGNALFNYFLAGLPLMLLSAGLMWLFKASDASVRAVLLAELFAVMAVTLLREGQILSSKYSPLQTFLYLCGLEIIPLAALIII